MSGTEYGERQWMTLEQVQQKYGQVDNAKEFFYDWHGLNNWLFKAINDIHNPDYDSFMLFVTQLGEKKFVLQYLSIFAIYALLSLVLKKIMRRGGVKQHFLMWFGALAVMCASFAVTMGIAYILKDYFQYPRPYAILPSAEFTQIEMQAPEKAYMSFPSGHVAFITLMVTALWPVLSHHIRLFGLFLIALVAWSRVALGVHFPADTVWAFLIAGVATIGVRATLYTFLRKFLGINCGGA